MYRVFSLMKRWELGIYHGLRREHIETYLNEFVFPFNRRFYRHVSFETILGIASRHAPTGYWNIVGRANPRKGKLALRKSPRRRKTAKGTTRDQPPRPREVRRLAAPGSQPRRHTASRSCSCPPIFGRAWDNCISQGQ